MEKDEYVLIIFLWLEGYLEASDISLTNGRLPFAYAPDHLLKIVLEFFI